MAVRKGAVIKYWNPKPTSPNNPYSVALAIPDLLPLISSRTRIVAITACSNILGSIIPVEEVVKAVRERAAKESTNKLEICVDCVAYAPHRKIDVQKWDVDYCYFSFYKVRLRSRYEVYFEYDMTMICIKDIRPSHLSSLHSCRVSAPTDVPRTPLPSSRHPPLQTPARRSRVRDRVRNHRSRPIPPLIISIKRQFTGCVIRSYSNPRAAIVEGTTWVLDRPGAGRERCSSRWG